MRPIRTIAPLALGLVALAVAGCQRFSDPTTTAPPTPTQVERATPTTTPNRQAAPPSRPPATTPNRQAALPSRPPASAAPKPKPDPSQETIVGLWPVRMLAQAKELQDGADAGHQPWLLSPELVSTSYAAAELDVFDPVARQVGPAAHEVGSRDSEWVATLYLAQPVRTGPGGVWIVTRTGNPMVSY